MSKSVYFDKGFAFEAIAEPSSEQSTLSYVFLNKEKHSPAALPLLLPKNQRFLGNEEHMLVKAQAWRTGKPSYEGILRRCGGNVAKAFIKIVRCQNHLI